MFAIFGKSWLTTVVGILGAVLQLATAYLQKGAIEASDLSTAATYIILGGVAKSFNVTGGPK